MCLAEENGRSCQRSTREEVFPGIQPQPTFLFARPVTGNAMVYQDRPYAPLKVFEFGFLCETRNGRYAEQGDQ